LQNPGVEGFCNNYLPFLRKYDLPVIVNIWGKTVEQYAETARMLSDHEGIDALEVMGINSASYLIMPKIIAAVIVIPLLVIISASLSVLGGLLAGDFSGIVIEKNTDDDIVLINGDIIEIDVHKKAMNVLISDDEIEVRKKALKEFEPKVKRGWLLRYSKVVTSADEGAVLKV